jgi:hypothetical protein
MTSQDTSNLKPNPGSLTQQAYFGRILNENTGEASSKSKLL